MQRRVLSLRRGARTTILWNDRIYTRKQLSFVFTPSLKQTSSTTTTGNVNGQEKSIDDTLETHMPHILKDISALLSMMQSITPYVPNNTIMNQIFRYYADRKDESSLRLLLKHLERHVGEDRILLTFKNLYLKVLCVGGFQIEALKMFQAMKRRHIAQSYKKASPVELANMNYITYAIMIKYMSDENFSMIRDQVFNAHVKNKYYNFSPSAYVYLYNLMIERLIEMRLHNDAISLFHEMTVYGTEDYKEKMNSYSDLPVEEMLDLIHQDVPKPPLPNAHTFALLMHGFIKLKDFTRAIAIFNKLRREVLNANSGMKSFYSPIEGVENPNDYLSQTIQTPIDIYHILMRGLSFDLNRLLLVMRDLIADGHTPTVKTYNFLMNACIAKQVKRLKGGNVPAPVVFGPKRPANPEAQKLIGETDETSAVEQILNLCKDMFDRFKLTPNEETISILMKALCVNGKPDQAYKAMLNAIKTQNIVKLRDLYHVLIRYYASHDPSRAIELIDEMASSKIIISDESETTQSTKKKFARERYKKPHFADAAELAIMLNGFLMRKEFEKAIAFVDVMTKKYNIEPDNRIRYILAKCYAQRRLMTHSVNLLSENFENEHAHHELFNIHNRRKAFIVTQFNNMIHEFFAQEEYYTAEYLLHEGMVQQGVFPDTTSYNLYMQSLIDRKRSRDALTLFNQVFRIAFREDPRLANEQYARRAVANEQTIHLVIAAHCLSDSIETAEELISEIEKGRVLNVQPDTTMFSLIISAYERVGHLTKMREWVDKLSLLESKDSLT